MNNSKLQPHKKIFRKAILELCKMLPETSRKICRRELMIDYVKRPIYFMYKDTLKLNHTLSSGEIISKYFDKDKINKLAKSIGYELEKQEK